MIFQNTVVIFKQVKLRFIVLIGLFFCFNSFVAAQSSYSAQLTLPSEIVQGESVKVILEIYKPNDLRNYVVFSQKLPEGFYVKGLDLPGTNISFENNELLLTWMRMPEGSKVTVSYELSAMVGLTGSYDISGNLSYLIGSKQGKFDLKTQRLTVVKKKKQEIISENKLTYDPIIQVKSSALKDISSSRKVEFNKKKNAYDVEILIKKKTAGSCVIVEMLPKNFEFIQEESFGAAVFQNKTLVQYYWKRSPDSKEMIIKYQLNPIGKDTEKPKITGKLSFLSDGQILNMPILTLN